ncbi:uncharacterized protein LOC101846736 [Aplysia californica]|uniref:Uncharacterized protein LOC101846736 n=1 Tax=Aplysia californica TaxID=6500 RepID=A0ABM0JR42_APLCA|nr:uncharacterized protein LOC101846736 [Aplysia californica]
MAINDANNDSFVTGPEIFNDFKNNYDTNKDGCITLVEWKNRWEQGLLLSKEYALNRWAAVPKSKDPTCPVKYAFYRTNTDIKIPVAGFLGDNLKTLVDTCKSDSSLLTSNCDCSQLLGACTKNPYLSQNAVCKAYVAKPITPAVG